MKLQSRIKGDGDSYSAQSTDEAFLSKGSSQEELDEHHKVMNAIEMGDSDGGVHEDSENELMGLSAPALPPRAGTHVMKPKSAPTLPTLSDSMPALTLALTSTPFSLSHQGSSSLSQSQPGQKLALLSSGVLRSGSPCALGRESSNRVISSKKKLSVKLRKGGQKEEPGKNYDEDDLCGSVDQDENGHFSKNPFHRAKKHIKTFMSGSKQKPDKLEAMLLESDASEVEEGDTVTFNSSTPSTLTLDETSGQCVTPEHIQKDQSLNNSRLDSKIKSQSMDSYSKDVRHTRSFQFPLTACSASISEHDFNPSDLSSNQQQKFHRKITRGDDISYGIMSKPRHDRREERRKLIAERCVDCRTSFGSVGEDFMDRRGSEDLMFTTTDYRRGSRDSNQSGSPLHSSQDSLFDSHSSVYVPTAQNTLAQSLFYGYGPTRVLAHSAAPGVTAQQQCSKLYIREQKDQSKASNILEMISSRDVRRTRSVSESRPDGQKKEYTQGTPLGFSEISSEDVLSSTSSLGKKFQNLQNGHSLEKMTKYHRGEICGICKKNMHVLFAPGCRCERCRMLFHTKCLSTGIEGKSCPVPVVIGSPSLKVNSYGGASGRKKHRKPSKSASDVTKAHGKFNLTGTSEFTDRTDQIISGVRELQLMQEFISRKARFRVLKPH